ncbi:MAG: transposase [Patescibacteria group bacterium]
MPYRKEEFANGEYYHVMNRGMDGSTIFRDQFDYKRFLEGLGEFNTDKPITIQLARKLIKIDTRCLSNPSAQKLVQILCYCLLPNHFHILIKQVVDGGVSLFMRKLCNGFAKYINIRHERMGHLFQGPFRAVRIKSDAHFMHISRYIHLNTFDLQYPEWREGKINDWAKALEFLEQYPWSSYPFYKEIRNSTICDSKEILTMFGGIGNYEKFLKEWTRRGSIDVHSFGIADYPVRHQVSNH